MDRSQWFTGAIVRSYDLLKADRRAFIGLGFGITDTIGGIEDSAAGTAGKGSLGDNLYNLSDHGGSTAASPLGSSSQAGQSGVVVGGFEITNPSGLIATVNPGSVYFSMQTDFVQATATQWVAALADTTGATAAALSPLYSVGAGALTGYGDIAYDATAEAVQFIVPAASFTLAAPALGGKTYASNAYLVFVVPAQVDETAADDPNKSAASPYNAVLPYYNAALPSQPLQGPGGTNPPTQQPSGRIATGALFVSAPSLNQSNSSQLVADQAAIAALTMPAGALPLYVVVIHHGNSTISSPLIFAAGLGGTAAAGTYPLTALIAQSPAVNRIAPFLRGLNQQHHLGVPGSAPQIDGGAEWLPKSTVNNNAVSFVNADDLYLFGNIIATSRNQPAGTTAPTAPTPTDGPSPVNSASFIGADASETAGTIEVTFTSGNISAGIVVIATITNASGIAPAAVALTPYGLAGGAGLSTAYFTTTNICIGWVRISGGWDLVILNNTGSNYAVNSTTPLVVTYIAIY